MSKEIIVQQVQSRLAGLGISCSTGQASDITIKCEFLDASWGSGNKKISYESYAFCDESSRTVFMWEMTKETGSGFSFGGSSQSTFQSGTTLFRKVKSVQYGADGKAFEYTLDLGAIPKAIKETAKQFGWKFKTVLKKEKAMYPQGYIPFAVQQQQPAQQQPPQYGNPQGAFYAQGPQNKPKAKTSAFFWILFIITAAFDILLVIGGSGTLFLALSAITMIIVFALRRKISGGFVRTVFSYLLIFVITFLVFAFSGQGGGNEANLSIGGGITDKLAGFSLSIGSKDKPEIESVGFARTVEEGTLKPLDKTDVFNPNDDFIYYSVLAKYIPENTSALVKWYYEGQLVVQVEPDVMKNAVENCYYTVHLQKGVNPFPEGKYSVELVMSREGKEIYKSTGEFTVDSDGGTVGSQSNDSGNIAAGNSDPTMVAINKSVKVGALEYKVISSRTLKTGSIFAPKESGNHFVLINIEIKNTADTTFETQYGGPLAVSLFTLKNTEGKPELGYNVAGGTGDAAGKYDSTKSIDAGQTVSGEVQYEVPADISKFILELSGESSDISPVTVEIPVSN